MSKKIVKKTLTLAERVTVIRRLDNQESQTNIATSFGVNQSAISRISKNREEILREWRLNPNPDRKRKRPGKAKDVEDALWSWFTQATGLDLPVSGLTLMERAGHLARELNINGFRPTSGWLERWKKRYNIAFKRQPPSPQQQLLQQHEKQDLDAGIGRDFAEVKGKEVSVADNDRKENDVVHFAEVMTSLDVLRRFMEQSGCQTFSTFYELKETLFQLNQQAAARTAVTRFLTNH